MGVGPGDPDLLTLAAVGAWLAVSIAAFAVIPGGFAANLSGWWSDLADFQDQLDGIGVPLVASTEFINISAAHALTVIDDWFTGAPGFKLDHIGAGEKDACPRWPEQIVSDVFKAGVFILQQFRRLR